MGYAALIPQQKAIVRHVLSGREFLFHCQREVRSLCVVRRIETAKYRSLGRYVNVRAQAKKVM